MLRDCGSVRRAPCKSLCTAWSHRFWATASSFPHTTSAEARAGRALDFLCADLIEGGCEVAFHHCHVFSLSRPVHNLSTLLLIFLKIVGSSGRHAHNAGSSVTYRFHQQWQMVANLPPVTPFRPLISHPTAPFHPSRQRIPAGQWRVVAGYGHAPVCPSSSSCPR